MCNLYVEITSEAKRKYKYRKWGPGLWVDGGRHHRGWTGTVMPIFVFSDLTVFMWSLFHSLSSRKRTSLPFSLERKFKKIKQ